MSAAIGLEICARRTRDATIAVAAESAAKNLRTLGQALDDGHENGAAISRNRTGNRLRWEWLASTAMLVDGRCDHRLLSECSSALSELVASAPIKALGRELSARLRVASAEAYSLSVAVAREVHADLVVAYAFA
jgi:hypothetical protein